MVELFVEFEVMELFDLSLVNDHLVRLARHPIDSLLGILEGLPTFETEDLFIKVEHLTLRGLESLELETLVFELV